MNPTAKTVLSYLGGYICSGVGFLCFLYLGLMIFSIQIILTQSELPIRYSHQVALVMSVIGLVLAVLGTIISFFLYAVNRRNGADWLGFYPDTRRAQLGTTG